MFGVDQYVVFVGVQWKDMVGCCDIGSFFGWVDGDCDGMGVVMCGNFGCYVFVCFDGYGEGGFVMVGVFGGY